MKEDAGRVRIARPLYLLWAGLWAVAACFFYSTYVPLVPEFQFALAPLLVLVSLLTAFRFEWGTVAFVFFLPLINNLPYFFGLFEPLPLAPAALVLFLAYFLGWLLHRAVSAGGAAVQVSMARPLTFFSAAVAASAIVTFFRYSNFFPFLEGAIYELKTNVNGLTAGGALMSVVFNALNYLTGILFLIVLLTAGRPARLVKPVLAALCAGSLLSLGFGLYQALGDKTFGNHPLSIRTELINATFKDALAFGAYLAMLIPLLLGASLAFRGWVRWISTAAILLSFYMVLFSGSKIAIVSSAVSALLFAALALRLHIKRKRADRERAAAPRPGPVKRLTAAAGLLAAAVLFAVFAGPLARAVGRSEVDYRLKGFERAVNYRLDTLWSMALAMMRDYPLTGVGMGGYIVEVANYARLNEVSLDPESAENALLQIGSELGLVGVLLALWIGWEIIRRARRTQTRLPPGDKRRFLLAGVIAALVSYALNAQFHSHIGSFEVQYAFCLLVGLVFWLGDGEGATDGVEKRPLGKAFAAAGCLLVAAYGAVHFWNSARSLSLESRAVRFDLEQDFGFYHTERTNDGREFRWTRDHGGMTVEAGKRVMSIPLLASHPDLHERLVTVDIYIVGRLFREKRLLKRVVLGRSVWRSFDVALPGEAGGKVLVFFKVSRTWNPKRATGAADRRDLGVAVGRVEFKSSL